MVVTLKRGDSFPRERCPEFHFASLSKVIFFLAPLSFWIDSVPDVTNAFSIVCGLGRGELIATVLSQSERWMTRDNRAARTRRRRREKEPPSRSGSCAVTLLPRHLYGDDPKGSDDLCNNPIHTSDWSPSPLFFFTRGFSPFPLVVVVFRLNWSTNPALTFILLTNGVFRARLKSHPKQSRGVIRVTGLICRVITPC